MAKESTKAIKAAFQQLDMVGMFVLLNIVIFSYFYTLQELSYPSLYEMLWYSQLPCFDVDNVTSDFNYEHGMLKRCW